MNWDACIICCGSEGDLRCPASSLQNNGLEIYQKFLKNVSEFKQLDSLPAEVKFQDNCTAEQFFENNAKWHKACYLKFATSKLEKKKSNLEKKRKKAEAEINKEQRRSKRLAVKTPDQDSCIFCSEETGKLHNCSTMKLDSDLKRMANELNDTGLLARISVGDLVANEAKYHFGCLTKFRNKYRAAERERTRSETSNKDGGQLQSLVFAELVSYIENKVENGTYIFTLTDLHGIYEKRLRNIGIGKTTNRFRLKLQLLCHFGTDCQEQFDGRNTLIVFKEGFQDLIKRAKESRDFENEAFMMTKLVKILREDMLNCNFEFQGNFEKNSQQSSVPTALKALVALLLDGTNVLQENDEVSQACLTITQLIMFNMKNRAYKVDSSFRHSKIKEFPLPLYVGLSLHTETRSKKLVDTMNKLGMSISYNRVLEVENQIGTAVCKRFLQEGLVCPAVLKKGLYTVGALDNIDYNPSSATAQGSFHGTGISIFQFPTSSHQGVSREQPIIDRRNARADISLPRSYTTVPAVACNSKNLTVPESNLKEIECDFDKAKKDEELWGQHASTVMRKEILEKDDNISWTAYHASQQPYPTNPRAIISMLPLFYEKAVTFAMIKHGMTLVKQITDHLNPGQIPVIALDQPLYTLAKYIQWQFPETFGEQRYVVMFGGLHIEIALWNTIGELLENSGWTTVLSDAGIVSEGTAISLLKTSHLTKTRHYHQVTALALMNLQIDAWDNMSQMGASTNFQDWKENMIKKSPTFQFWNIVLEFEKLVLMFVRAHRTRDFRLFIKTLEALVFWFFALDRTNYSRWIPIHIRDMKSLHESVEQELATGWVLQKSEKRFSSMPLDQAHEQNNSVVKGSGGAIGLTENPTAFRKWMVAGPEQARLIETFESASLGSRFSETLEHHEEGLSSQRTFKKQVVSLCNTITSVGNPFLDDCTELLALDSRNCASESVVHTVRNIENIGKAQYEKYVKEVIIDRTTSIHQSIKKNNLPLFKRPNLKETSKAKDQIANLKSDCNLFGHLYIASKFRDGNLEEFFSHENHPWPPALSVQGKLNLPNKKSELLHLLDKGSSPQVPSYFHCKIFDGTAIVHALPYHQASSFGEYGDKVFLPWVNQQLIGTDRIDIVWDTYREDSIKESTREKRGKGIRRKVGESTKLPRNFQDFLRHGKNKEELFHLLTRKVMSQEYEVGKEIYITSGGLT